MPTAMQHVDTCAADAQVQHSRFASSSRRRSKSPCSAICANCSTGAAALRRRRSQGPPRPCGSPARAPPLAAGAWPVAAPSAPGGSVPSTGRIRGHEHVVQVEAGVVSACMRTKQAIMHQHLKVLKAHTNRQSACSSNLVVFPSNSMYIDANTRAVRDDVVYTMVICSLNA